ncbi:DNA adenine methylase [Metabacillus bambusae]|uniref:site-specific DNA-methyltransferase (adenine-specific) n=1 Tax=Metabacillus bambusae TaxID=2795218 RepID=A0ABS3N7M6_9BACI|nr:DNA adenine methylase [Metabacillus bambusae]MBO1514297.1 DNA adenine methylase [Metabacillus bambusae]
MSNYSPLRYPGGKYKTYRYIKPLILKNKCTTYIEPFAGGAAVALSLLIEGIVRRVIINDYDRSIYALWYSILNYPDELIQLIINTDITMDEWYQQKEIQNNKLNAPILELGFSTLFLNRTNRSGIIKAGVIGGKNQNSEYQMDCRFPKNKLINKIKLISHHKDQIEIHNLDALDFIDNIIKRTRNSFTFFDPPYFKQGPNLYTNFYKFKDHMELSEKIQKELKNRKWIVTYDHEIEIKQMYKKLPYIEYYLNYTAQNKTKGIEYMFYSKCTNIGEPDNYLNTFYPLFDLAH